MLGSSILNPLVWTRAVETSLCRDHQPGRIRVQRFSNNLFTHVGTVGVRGVNEIDSQFDRALQYTYRFGTIGWLTPDSVARDAHSAETKTIDTKIASDRELAALRS